MKRLCYIPIIILLSLTMSSCLKEKLASHNFVDLGLPSGLLWATCNLGATSPEDYGNYYAWGETTPKTDYSWDTYTYGKGENQLTKYCCDPDYGYNGFTDNLTTLLSIDDAATVTLGKGYRIPTIAEWQELIDNTTYEWTTVNKVKGLKFTASNGNRIFLPAAGSCFENGEFSSVGEIGWYWSSSLSTRPVFARDIYFQSGFSGVGVTGGDERYYGQSVRAVRSQN